MRKNNAFDKKIVNTRLTKTFIALFAPDERLPSSATLLFTSSSITSRHTLLLAISNRLLGVCVKKIVFALLLFKTTGLFRVPKRMIFVATTFGKGGPKAGHFQFKKLVCRFWTTM